MAVTDRYATFANFGGGYKDQSTRPQIKRVLIAECIKRRLPSKHYVYKMVVDWTSGTTSVVYRRYSMFFDFQVKLQELYLSVCEKHPQFVEKVPHLPELPGKILFGRSHVHQVAEKRRGKIEEFCQQVVSLPPEISHSNLVMGFFNTWPEDTMLPMHHTESVSSSNSSFSSLTASTPSTTQHSLTSPTSPTTLTTPSTSLSPPSTTSATEAIITHPDEMENLEQFCVLADYRRKDSHQVNLSEGQVVHVIEKHDTGWWMVMSDDEQGYAPAAYLEPVEGGGKQALEQQQALDGSTESCEEYEAMESYSAQGEDEVAFTVGDRIEVLNKSLDGWWKIRCNTKVGLAPSALIRKKIEAPQPQGNDVIYESHKSIYEGLNIHKPPPRRNTIERNYNHLVALQQEVYAVPRPNPPLLKMAPEATLIFDDTDHDYVEPPLEMTSEDEDDPAYYRIPRPLQSSMSDTNSNKWNGSVSSPPPKSSNDSVRPLSSESSITNTQRDSTGSDPRAPVTAPPSSQEKTENDDFGRNGIYDMVPEEFPHEMEPGSTDVLPRPSSSSSSAIYQTNGALTSPEVYKTSSATYSEPNRAPSGSVPNGSSSMSSTSPPPQSHTTPSSTAALSGRNVDDDYVDIDQHDEYVDPGELKGRPGEGGSEAVPPPQSPSSSYDLFKPLPKPPLPTSDPPKKKPMMAKSKSLCIELSDTSGDGEDDEYIPMDPIYTEPPLEDPDPSTTNASVVSTQQEQQQQKQRKQSKSATPSTPSSASSSSSFFSPSPLSLGKPRKLYPKLKVSRDKVHISSPVLVEKKTGLTKAKSLEDLLGSPGSRESSPQRLGSPQSERKGSPGRVPVFPPIPTATSVGKGTTGHTSSDLKSRVKSKSGGKVKTGRAGKRHSEIQVPHHVLQSSCSPPRGPSPEHRGVTHTTSVPIPPPIPHNGPSVKETSSSLHLKTYVALSSYQSQVANSLSFQAGDKCVLLRMTQDGWWLVNIGGREGWTPEAYWREEAWNQTSTIARPPGPAPTVSPLLPPERKSRSHTVASDGVSVPASSSVIELSASMESGLEIDASSSEQSSWAGSVEVDRQDTPSEGTKPPPPPPPPQNTKPVRREPPLLKPKPTTPIRKKGEKKPPVPHKPNNLPPKTNSPPLSRHHTEDTPSPPPPPAATVNQRRPNDAQANDSSEYVMLENAHTLDPLVKSTRKLNIERLLTPIGIEFGPLPSPTRLIHYDTSSWFVGKMERVTAEQFLMEHGRQREFLVRERAAKDGYYALSIRYHYSCKHFNIDPTPQGQYMIGNLTFPAISDIVYHYQNNSLFIHEDRHVTLSVPARRRTRGAVDTRNTTHS